MDYETGILEALHDFGLEKSANVGTALTALVGAGTGYALDPEHSWQSAALGGAIGASAGHSMFGAGAPHQPQPKPKLVAQAPAPAVVPPAAPALQNITPPVHTAPSAPPPPAVPEKPTTAYKQQDLPMTIPPSQKPPQQLGFDLQPPKKGKAAKPQKEPVQQELPLGPEQLSFKLSAHKLSADIGVSGPGFSMAPEPKERLPGMKHWVPRTMIEQINEQLDSGAMPDDIVLDDSPVRDIASGAIPGAVLGLGAGRALGNTMRSAATGGAVGAGIGAVGGLGAHLLGKDRREADFQDALGGVMREREDTHHSAREAPPLTVPTNIDA